MSFDNDVIVSNNNVTPDQASTIIQVGLDTGHFPTPLTPTGPAPPSAPNLAWDRANGKPEACARLSHLPDGVNLDVDIDEPIHYDAARKVLMYRGFMCHGSYTYLRTLSADLEYLSALDQLYVCTANRGSQRRFAPLGLGLSLVALLGAGLVFFLRR
jgi:hypothetical protein